MSSFVTSDSGLVFDLLGLTGVLDWLTIPAVHWENFSQFKKLQEFAQNISFCNNIAERGIALISSYINRLSVRSSARHCFKWLNSTGSWLRTPTRIH